jgi:hypothetical protein
MNAVLLQHTYSASSIVVGDNCFNDMLRLTYQRHAAYAMAHRMDHWCFQGGIHPENPGEAGAWAKIHLMKMALKDYEYIFWVDADAAIMDFETDLRDAVKDIDIGACVHDPEKSPYLKQLGIDKHINVGVMYLRNTDLTNDFIDKWLASYPGPKRWAEQGAFNELIKTIPAVSIIDDKWNATVNVNMVKKPVVMGWHGVMPSINRFLQMKAALADDFLTYRV